MRDHDEALRQLEIIEALIFDRAFPGASRHVAELEAILQRSFDAAASARDVHDQKSAHLLRRHLADLHEAVNELQADEALYVAALVRSELVACHHRKQLTSHHGGGATAGRERCAWVL